MIAQGLTSEKTPVRAHASHRQEEGAYFGAGPAFCIFGAPSTEGLDEATSSRARLTYTSASGAFAGAACAPLVLRLTHPRE